jgi:pimeloyl-ACP methyl ester carboxylesterase
MRLPVIARALLIAIAILTASCQSVPRGAITLPHGDSGHPATPLVLSRQGSFFVNARSIEVPTGGGTAAPGHISTRGMYVQYQIPHVRNRRAYPVIFVPGSSHTGKTYEETPDGRMGWAEYFVRKGVPVYVVDSSGRARSGFDPSPANRAEIESGAAPAPRFGRFTNERAWMIFRFGPRPFVAYENTRFPVEAQAQYFAQLVPNTESSYPEGGQNTTDALAALLDRVGPAVVLVHSLSGTNGLRTAIARPDLVKAVVSIEPGSCAVPDADVKSVFTRVPLLTMFGDFFGTNVDNWPGRMAECVQTVNRINAVRGTAENIYLPDRGIHGNSHMLMMDRNNIQLADIILDWLKRNANAP